MSSIDAPLDPSSAGGDAQAVDGVRSRPHSSRFEDWDERAAVRVKPLATITPGDRARGLFFSPELVPAASHPLVLARGPTAVEKVLAYHLLTHLDFTDVLENEVVLPVAYMIGRERFGLRLPPNMAADARKIAVDEMHHALLATSLVAEIAALSGVAPMAVQRPAFILRLESILAETDLELRALVRFFFAVVSETLITGTLSQVPKDTRVMPGVRQMLRDHAEDETRHHAFFADALMQVWPQLRAHERALIGPLLPEFISLFITPDPMALGEALSQIGLARREIDRLKEEAYATERLNRAAIEGSGVTLRHFRRAGVFEDARTADAFGAAGFMP
jgi:hypothetical protein